MATAAQMQVHDYNMGDDTLPVAAALRTDPSAAGMDPAFGRMQAHAQQLFETTHGTLVRHQYEADASAQLQGQRIGDLAHIYSQGKGHSVIQAERGSAALERFNIDSDAEASSEESPEPRRRDVHHGVGIRLQPTGNRAPTPQLRSFRELNQGQRAPTSGSASVREGEDESYETMRLHRVTKQYLGK